MLQNDSCSYSMHFLENPKDLTGQLGSVQNSTVWLINCGTETHNGRIECGSNSVYVLSTLRPLPLRAVYSPLGPDRGLAIALCELETEDDVRVYLKDLPGDGDCLTDGEDSDDSDDDSDEEDEEDEEEEELEDDEEEREIKRRRLAEEGEGEGEPSVEPSDEPSDDPFDGGGENPQDDTGDGQRPMRPSEVRVCEGVRALPRPNF